jgi:glucosamine-6-phosphate deaminase
VAQATPFSFRVDNADVTVHSSRRQSGQAAALHAADLIRAAIAARGRARIVVGTGNSQLAVVDALAANDGIEWSRVEAFHMDEYVGISPMHPASFRLWLHNHLASKRRLAAMHYIEGDAPGLAREVERYSQLLNAAPLDVAFVGFGENGHVAFNDPPAEFLDRATVKVVDLAPACIAQQVGEGHFVNAAAVPTQAVTVTCPGLFRAAAWICCVPEARKAHAVRQALEGPIDAQCPASISRTHPAASIYLDQDSAALLTPKQPAPISPVAQLV